MNTTHTRLYTLLTIGCVAAATWLTSLPAAAQGMQAEAQGPVPQVVVTAKRMTHPVAAQGTQAEAQAPVPQVIVTAKRMTQAEREAERAAAGAPEQVHRVVIIAKRLRPAANEAVGVAARETLQRPL